MGENEVIRTSPIAKGLVIKLAYAIKAATHFKSIADALVGADIVRLLLHGISDTTRYSIVLLDDFKVGDPSSMILLSALVRSMTKSASKSPPQSNRVGPVESDFASCR